MIVAVSLGSDTCFPTHTLAFAALWVGVILTVAVSSLTIPFCIEVSKSICVLASVPRRYLPEVHLRGALSWRVCTYLAL